MRKISDEYGLSYEELIRLVSNNKPLIDVINKVVDEYDNVSAHNDTSEWEWDLEENIFAQLNHDFTDFDEDFEDGWEYSELEENFKNYFELFEWDMVRANNGDYVLILDECDYINIVFCSPDKIEDGQIEINYFKLFGPVKKD
jgi:hypothetical protein